MHVRDIPEVAQLSTPEKILLIEDLWDSIASDESGEPVPRSHVEELDRRFKSYQSDPGNLLSLEELQARIPAARPDAAAISTIGDEHPYE